MIKIPRSQSTTIKNIMYPDVKKTGKNFQIQNMKNIKQQQAINKAKREEKENYAPPEPYKLKEFLNVPSKLYQKVEHPVSLNEKEKEVKTERKVTQTKSSSHIEVAKKNIPKGRPLKPHSQQMNYQSEKRPIKVLNEFVKKMPLDVEEYKQIDSTEENIYAIGRKHSEENLEKYYNEHKEQSEKQRQKEKNQEEVDYESLHKVHLKGPTPRANEINILPPKQAKNHLAENRLMVTENKIPAKFTNKEEPESAIHKNYGKTPDYLQKYKQEAEEKKAYEKRLQEEAKYPKGTRLLSEDERVTTLNGLIESKKEIITLLEKMPITMRTMAVQNRKAELEKKLDELDDAIATFSRKQVFIKVES